MRIRWAARLLAAALLILAEGCSDTRVATSDAGDGADGSANADATGRGGPDATDGGAAPAMEASDAGPADGAPGSEAGADGGCVAPRIDAILAATPPMGWNSWNEFGASVSASLVREIADAMVSSGMRDAGYQYVNIDDTWSANTRDASGNLVADPLRFPGGIAALADYVHCRGLKLGVYGDRGAKTCAGRPGSYGHETQDANTFAAWGVDYLKYDNCNAAAGRDDLLTTQADYTAMSDALVATGRPIVFSMSAWWFYGFEPSIANLWRTTTDITDTWESMTANLDRNGGDTGRYGNCVTCSDAGGSCVICNTLVPEAAYGAPGLTSYAGQGTWNDPDMLEVGNGGMTDDEDRAQFALWSIMAAPLIAGNDLRSMTPAAMATLTNADIIAVDQDPLGLQGRPIGSARDLEVWVKRLSGNATYAVALLNRTASAADISVTFGSLGIASGSATVRDLWAHEDLGPVSSQYTANVPTHGVTMLKVVGQ
jgi:alpha-galactosidase